MADGIGFTTELFSAYRPSTLGTLRAWYDASQESFADGDAVGTFTDQSGNGYHLTQATGANKPLFKISAANGRAALLFDGSNDYLATAAFGARAHPVTVYLVASSPSGSTGRFLVDGIGASNRMLVATAFPSGAPIASSGTNLTGLHDVGLDWFLLEVVFNTTTSTIRLNDIYQISGNTGSQTLTGITMGAAYDFSAPWVGYIAEALYFDGTLSTDNAYTIRRALMAKYKIDYFDPSSITGLRSVFMADALRLRDGEAVSEWLDGYGSYDLVQATGSKQPIYKRDIQNHRPIVRFDGSNDFLRSASFAALAQQCTVFIVGKHDNATASQIWFDGIGGSNRQLVFSNVTDGVLVINAGTSLNSATDVGTSFVVLSAVFNAGSSAIYKNGTSVASGAAGSQVLTGYTLGSAYDDSLPFDGDIAEVLVYEGALSTVNRQRVEGYLRTKYTI
jgi:hypothetical protein